MTPAMRVVEEVASEFGVGVSDILGKSRLAHIVTARREAIRRLYLTKRMSTPALASLFNANTTSIRHHLRAAGVKGCRSRLEITAWQPPRPTRARGPQT